MAEAFDRGDDLVGGLGPAVGLGVFVVRLNEAMISASTSAVDRWTPRCSCLRVSSANQRSTWLIQEADVGVKCTCEWDRRASQALILGVLCLAWYVHHELHVAVGGRSVDLLEEIEKLGCPMALVALPDHCPCGDVECREQRGCAVANVSLGAPLGYACRQRKDWLLAVERLNLGLFVDTQHDCPVRRRHVEVDDVLHLVDEQRVCGQLEGLGLMRLKAKGRQIRGMVVWGRPVSAAMLRIDQ